MKLNDWQKIDEPKKICSLVQKGLWNTFYFQLIRYTPNGTIDVDLKIFVLDKDDEKRSLLWEAEDVKCDVKLLLLYYFIMILYENVNALLKKRFQERLDGKKYQCLQKVVPN